MKCMRIYIMILGIALLLSINLFINSGWAETERDVLSFVSEKGDAQPIVLMNTRGKILERLMTDPGEPSDFTWSPDKRSIAYSSFHGGNFDIYVMDVEANTHRQLTVDGHKDLSPAWSPSGKWIAFTSDRAGSRNIYRMDVDGENVRQLTNRRNCRYPAWSPNSQWIAFTSESSLFVMDAGGKRLRKLSAHVSFGGCTWSPDGKQIAFVLNTNIVSIGIDGKNLQQLARADPLSLIWNPVWSPSGKWIAYIMTQLPRGPIDQIFANGVIGVVDIAEGGRGKPIESTKGMPKRSLRWVPEEFFSVSPSTEKQTTLWGRLKQMEGPAK